MNRRIEVPFESIENAQRYIRLLAETVTEASHDIDNEITLATDQMLDRRVQALRMVEYSLEKLQRYLSLTGRTLNDLRSLRRILLEERSATNDAKRRQVAETPPLETAAGATAEADRSRTRA